MSLVELGEDIGWKTAIDLLALSLEESGWYFVVAGDGVKWVFSRANLSGNFIMPSESILSNPSETAGGDDGTLSKQEMSLVAKHALMFSRSESFFLHALDIQIGPNGCSLQAVVEGLSWIGKHKELKSLIDSTKRYIVEKNDTVRRSDESMALCNHVCLSDLRETLDDSKLKAMKMLESRLK